MELLTARLRLRLFVDEDLPQLARICSDAEVMRFIGDGARSQEQTAAAMKRTAAHWKKHGFGMLAVDELGTGQLIGRCGLQHVTGRPEVEVGYLLSRARWGRGLATEAARAVITWGFTTLALQEIHAVALPDNRASIHVMKKLGFTFCEERQAYGVPAVCYVLTQSSRI